MRSESAQSIKVDKAFYMYTDGGWGSSAMFSSLKANPYPESCIFRGNESASSMKEWVQGNHGPPGGWLVPHGERCHLRRLGVTALLSRC